MATRKAHIRIINYDRHPTSFERVYDELNYKKGGIIELKRYEEIVCVFNSHTGYIVSTEPVDEPKEKKKGFGKKD